MHYRQIIHIEIFENTTTKYYRCISNSIKKELVRFYIINFIGIFTVSIVLFDMVLVT